MYTYSYYWYYELPITYYILPISHSLRIHVISNSLLIAAYCTMHTGDLAWVDYWHQYARACVTPSRASTTGKAKRHERSSMCMYNEAVSKLTKQTKIYIYIYTRIFSSYIFTTCTFGKYIFRRYTTIYIYMYVYTI